MNNSNGSRRSLPSSWKPGKELAPMEAAEAPKGLPNADGRKPEAFPQPLAEAEHAMREALMGCYNG